MHDLFGIYWMTEINENINTLKQLLLQISERRHNYISLFNNANLDAITQRHSNNTMALMANLGICLNMSFYKLSILASGALLHDIGKTSREIRPLIETPRKLSEKEYKIVQKHTVLGYKLLRRYGVRNKCILEFTYNHHLREDVGYPFPNQNIPISNIVSLFALIDSYEAMTSQDRVYHQRKTPYKAIELLKLDCENGKYGENGINNLEKFTHSLEMIGLLENPKLCPILVPDYTEIQYV